MRTIKRSQLSPAPEVTTILLQEELVTKSRFSCSLHFYHFFPRLFSPRRKNENVLRSFFPSFSFGFHFRGPSINHDTLQQGRGESSQVKMIMVGGENLVPSHLNDNNFPLIQLCNKKGQLSPAPRQFYHHWFLPISVKFYGYWEGIQNVWHRVIVG